MLWSRLLTEMSSAIKHSVQQTMGRWHQCNTQMPHSVFHGMVACSIISQHGICSSTHRYICNVNAVPDTCQQQFAVPLQNYTKSHMAVTVQNCIKSHMADSNQTCIKSHMSVPVQNHQIIFWLYSINNYILCWLVAWNVHAVAVPMYLGTWAFIEGLNIEWSDTWTFH